jgi:hypothetical protein
MENEKRPEYRYKDLQGQRSFTLVFSKDFAEELGITKRDFDKCQIKDVKLIIEKVNT